LKRKATRILSYSALFFYCVVPFGVSEFPVTAEDVRRLAKLVETHSLSELRYEEGDLRVTLRTGATIASASALSILPAHAVARAATPSPAAPVGRPVEAPIMGIFYRSPAPGAPAFVEVGDTVEMGEPIGMIEAMKTFSEVLSEVAGTVLAIPAENGKLVQPGEALVLLEPAV
jgi:acetyl-CoA carboxylase biotin carboxyl carrier protein